MNKTKAAAAGTKPEEKGGQGLTPKLRFPEFRDAGEWEEKKLKELSEFFKGRGISKEDIDAQGNTPCIRYGELYTIYGETIDCVLSKTNLPSSELFFSKKNDVIIPASGETKGDIATASCILVDNVALGGDLNIIRSSQQGIFISYFLNGPKRKKIAKIAQGDAVVHLYINQLKELTVSIPPLPEQQRIADCLSSLDEVITAHTQKLDALKLHKKGLLQQLFPAEGETVPRLRFPEFRDAGEWEDKDLSNYTHLTSGLHLAPSEYGTTGNVPYFTGPSDFTNNFTGVDKWTKKSSNLAKENDILITVKGSGVGELWHLALPCVAIGRQLMAIRSEGCLSQFLRQFLATKADRFKALASGNLIPGLSRENIQGIRLHFPSLPEQQKIADCLSSLDEVITAHSQKLDALKAHKKGLMQQLFPVLEEVRA